MEDLRKKIQSQFDENYSTDLSTFSTNELRDIDRHMNELNSSGHIHNITNLSKSENNFVIETKTGLTYFK